MLFIIKNRDFPVNLGFTALSRIIFVFHRFPEKFVKMSSQGLGYQSHFKITRLGYGVASQIDHYRLFEN